MTETISMAHTKAYQMNRFTDYYMFVSDYAIVLTMRASHLLNPSKITFGYSGLFPFPLRYVLDKISLSNHLTHISIQMINYFQFEDETATRVIRKKRFGVVFVLLTLIPATSIVSFFIWLGHTEIDLLAFTELLTYFSPLTHMDNYSIYIICQLSIFLPFILYRSYKGMETSLTNFAQIYNQCMHGIVCRGTY